MADYASFAGIPRVPQPVNDPNKSYLPGSPERAALKARLAEMSGERIEIPLIVGGEEIRTGRVHQAVMPHDHAHVLADWHGAESEHVLRAIAAAAEARKEWSSWAWHDRAACSSAPASCSPRPGAPPSTPPRCSDSRRRHSGRDRRRLGARRLLAVQPVLRAAALRGAADQSSGMWKRSNTGRSRASCSRSRRSTSRRSPATSRPHRR